MDPAVARIIDANFNRAREALRVMEDYARFVLNESGLTEQIKQLRHDLSSVVGRLPTAELLAARDTNGDVGTAISSRSELRRDSAGQVVLADSRRLAEALRSLAEYTKIVDQAVAVELEAMRYRGYELERRLALQAERPQRFARARLYVLISESACSGPWLATAEAAIDGGADCLQLREKDLSDAELLRRARALVELTRSRAVLCIINDRPDIARLAGADGVHLGQLDLPVAEARRIVGPDGLVGKSTHNLEQARAAIAERPDYIAVGPIFASQTKPVRPLAGLQTLRAVLSCYRGPCVAVGGITGQNVGQVVAAGGRCVAVCRAVVGAADPRQAAMRLRAAMGQAG
ncbi:MAG: thiamine phosphate synthase [Phycisphaerae bacterium]